MPSKKRKRAPEGDEEFAKGLVRSEGKTFTALAEHAQLFQSFQRQRKRNKLKSTRPRFKLDEDTVHGLSYFATLVRGLVGVDTPADAGGRRKRYPWTLSVSKAERLFAPLARRGLCEASFTPTTGRVKFDCLNKVVAAFGQPAEFYSRYSPTSCSHPPPPS
jgi:hypothetical protein